MKQKWITISEEEREKISVMICDRNLPKNDPVWNGIFLTATNEWEKKWQKKYFYDKDLWLKYTGKSK